MTIQIRAGTTDGAIQYNGVDSIVVSATIVTLPTALSILALDPSGYSIDAYAYVGTGGTNASVALRTARGTLTQPISTHLGDVIGNTDYFGYGTASAYAASLDCVATEAFTGSSTPTQFNFNVTPSGATSPSLAISIGQGITINTLTSSYYAISALVNNNVANGTGIQLGGGRGTQISPTAVLANDILGNIDFFGYGTSYLEGAAIDAIALSTWTVANAESALTFFVTANGNIVTSEKMRLSSNGALLVGTTAVPSASTTGSITFPTTATGDTIVTNGGVLSLTTESAGNYNFVGLGYSTGNTNNASIGIKSQTRGTSPVAANDTIFNLDGYGWNGAAYGYAASIDIIAGSTFSGSNYQSSIVFNTTALNSITPVAVGTLNNAGLTLLGGLTATGIIAVNGGISSTVTPEVAGATYSQLPVDSDIMVNYAGTVTLTLLNPATYPGRIITIRTYQGQLVNSASANVSINGAAGTAILVATVGKWATLKSDGTNWEMLRNN